MRQRRQSLKTITRDQIVLAGLPIAIIFFFIVAFCTTTTTDERRCSFINYVGKILRNFDPPPLPPLLKSLLHKLRLHCWHLTIPLPLAFQRSLWMPPRVSAPFERLKLPCIPMLVSGLSSKSGFDGQCATLKIYSGWQKCWTDKA